MSEKRDRELEILRHGELVFDARKAKRDSQKRNGVLYAVGEDGTKVKIGDVIGPVTIDHGDPHPGRN